MFAIMDIYERLVSVCGTKNVSKDEEMLKTYSKDLSFYPEKLPSFVIWPRNTKQVEDIVKLANELKLSIVTVSSSQGPRHHGDTVPRKNNSVVVDLSKMKSILNIDKKNRVVMIEPGVTFGELIPKLQKGGLRLLIPLYPRNSKSVVACALEREPITIPRYHWDSSDPLLCTEVIFGTGDLLRTGTAAGPGTIKEQQKAGQAQVNPMGPTQFDPFRVIQGSQGSLGIVTWATLKLELMPDVQKVFHLQSNNLQELLDFQYELIKYRLCDEMFILNDLNLACLTKETEQEIYDRSKNLKKWNLIYVLAGRAKLSSDKIAYLTADIDDIIKERNLDELKRESPIEDSEILTVINQASVSDWRYRLKGGYQDIFFISNIDRIPEFVNIVEKDISQDLGIYVQAINQGTSYHCEFDLFYDPGSEDEMNRLKDKFLDISVKLMDAGAFFNRPYGLWAPEVYKRHEETIINALKKVKKIFDPNSVLNPGVLCFEDKD